MDIFAAYFTDISDPGQHPQIAAQLREHGLVTLTGISSREAVAGAAARFMTIRPHRDSGPDGVTVITTTGPGEAGYAAFTDRELTPHTDSSGAADPPGLLLLACLQPAVTGGASILADGAKVAASLASRHPSAWTDLCSPDAATFGSPAGCYHGPVVGPAGLNRRLIRFRSDDLASFSDTAAAALPLLVAEITRNLRTVQLAAGQGILVSNTRWLHGRARHAGQRVMLRVLGDPLPWTGVRAGFPIPAAAAPVNPAAIAGAA